MASCLIQLYTSMIMLKTINGEIHKAKTFGELLGIYETYRLTEAFSPVKDLAYNTDILSQEEVENSKWYRSPEIAGVMAAVEFFETVRPNLGKDNKRLEITKESKLTQNIDSGFGILMNSKGVTISGIVQFGTLCDNMADLLDPYGLYQEEWFVDYQSPEEE